jgi:hypothetical protein
LLSQNRAAVFIRCPEEYVFKIHTARNSDISIPNPCKIVRASAASMRCRDVFLEEPTS